MPDPNKVHRALRRAFAREVNGLLRERHQIVLATADIQSTLSDGESLDGVTAMRLLRALARRHGWDTFVFDYGALVRIQPRASSQTGRPLHSDRQPTRQ
jgi:hypothetical protein